LLTHSDVRSFPTRRSSDLVIANQIFVGIGILASQSIVYMCHLKADACLMKQMKQDHRVCASADCQEEAVLGNRNVQTVQVGLKRDRKSTRLNSSHVKISYA